MPVANREFGKFVNELGHVTFAKIAPDPKDYPGALSPGREISLTKISLRLALSEHHP
jgi:hypothetical protein